MFLEPHCGSFQTTYISTSYFQVVTFEIVLRQNLLQLENMRWIYMSSESCRSVVLKTLGVFPTLDIYVVLDLLKVTFLNMDPILVNCVTIFLRGWRTMSWKSRIQLSFCTKPLWNVKNTKNKVLKSYSIEYLSMISTDFDGGWPRSYLIKLISLSD